MEVEWEPPGLVFRRLGMSSQNRGASCFELDRTSTSLPLLSVSPGGSPNRHLSVSGNEKTAPGWHGVLNPLNLRPPPCTRTLTGFRLVCWSPSGLWEMEPRNTSPDKQRFAELDRSFGSETAETSSGSMILRLRKVQKDMDFCTQGFRHT